MRLKTLIVLGCFVLATTTLSADTLGFVEQRFSDLHFEKGRWSRSLQLPCYTYTALEDGAQVEVLRIGLGNLVPLKATKGLKVTVCGSTAAFDEGFETESPISNTAAQKQRR
jgi:hypothetical protein